VRWASDKPAVAKVDNNGKVTAEAPGVAKIFHQSVFSMESSATFLFTPALSRKTKYYKNMSPKNISFYPRILKNH
jgi:hypothetical protein